MTPRTSLEKAFALADQFAARALRSWRMSPEDYFDMHYGNEVFVGQPQWDRFRRAWLDEYARMTLKKRMAAVLARDVQTLAGRLARYLACVLCISFTLVCLLLWLSFDAAAVASFLQDGRVSPEVLHHTVSRAVTLATLIVTFTYIAVEHGFSDRRWRWYSGGFLPSTQRLRSYMDSWSFHWWRHHGGVVWVAPESNARAQTSFDA